MNFLNSPLNRRQFLGQAAGGIIGSGLLSPSLQSAGLSSKGKATSVIYLYLSGGLSHLDSFDIKPENSLVRGESGALNTNIDGIRVSKFFPLLAKQMQHVAVINSLTTTQGAHAQGSYYMHTSHTQRGTIEHPELGAWLAKYMPPKRASLPSFVKIGGGRPSLGSGFFDGKYGALPIGDPMSGLKFSQRHTTVKESQFSRRMNLLDRVNKDFEGKYNHKLIKSYGDSYRDAVKLMNSADLKAFDIKEETAQTRDTYGQNSFGQGCLLARRLVEKGVRFVEVNSKDWDHHGNLYDDFPARAQELDKALSGLLKDLDQRGLLDSTMVVLATEFGRSPQLNSNGGRNHYPKAFSGLLAGGGIQGGQVYGKTDKDGAKVIANKVEVEDFNATIAYAVGMDLNKEVFSPSGRPFKVAHKGKPITSLF
jgi:uncharacterized protein (DUF1501 family)